jgi:ribose 5-phosphate isomerase B
MVANKYKNVRAALCWQVELAKLARQHNDANIVSIPARFISQATAELIVEAFLNTDFEGGRHLARVSKISAGL